MLLLNSFTHMIFAIKSLLLPSNLMLLYYFCCFFVLNVVLLLSCPINEQCCNCSSYIVAFFSWLAYPHRSFVRTYVDAVYCYPPSSVVSQSVTLVSPAKTAKPIEMPFRLWARMGPRNRVLGGGPEVLRDVAMATNFGTKIAMTGFMWTIATRLLVMEGVWVVGQQNADIADGRCHGNHFWLSIYWVYIGATWRIRLNHPCAAAMRPHVKLLWPLFVIHADIRVQDR